MGDLFDSIAPRRAAYGKRSTAKSNSPFDQSDDQAFFQQLSQPVNPVRSIRRSPSRSPDRSPRSPNPFHNQSTKQSNKPSISEADPFDLIIGEFKDEAPSSRAVNSTIKQSTIYSKRKATASLSKPIDQRTQLSKQSTSSSSDSPKRRKITPVKSLNRSPVQDVKSTTPSPPQPVRKRLGTTANRLINQPINQTNKPFKPPVQAAIKRNTSSPTVNQLTNQPVKQSDNRPNSQSNIHPSEQSPNLSPPPQSKLSRTLSSPAKLTTVQKRTFDQSNNQSNEQAVQAPALKRPVSQVDSQSTKRSIEQSNNQINRPIVKPVAKQPVKATKSSSGQSSNQPNNHSATHLASADSDDDMMDFMRPDVLYRSQSIINKSTKSTNNHNDIQPSNRSINRSKSISQSNSQAAKSTIKRSLTSVVYGSQANTQSNNQPSRHLTDSQSSTQEVVDDDFDQPMDQTNNQSNNQSNLSSFTTTNLRVAEIDYILDGLSTCQSTSYSDEQMRNSTALKLAKMFYQDHQSVNQPDDSSASLHPERLTFLMRVHGGFDRLIARFEPFLSINQSDNKQLSTHSVYLIQLALSTIFFIVSRDRSCNQSNNHSINQFLASLIHDHVVGQSITSSSNQTTEPSTSQASNPSVEQADQPKVRSKRKASKPINQSSNQTNKQSVEQQMYACIPNDPILQSLISQPNQSTDHPTSQSTRPTNGKGSKSDEQPASQSVVDSPPWLLALLTIAAWSQQSKKSTNRSLNQAISQSICSDLCSLINQSFHDYLQLITQLNALSNTPPVKQSKKQQINESAKQTILQSINQSLLILQLSMYTLENLSHDQPVNQSTVIDTKVRLQDPSTIPSFNHSITQPDNQSILQSNNQSIYQSLKQLDTFPAVLFAMLDYFSNSVFSDHPSAQLTSQIRNPLNKRSTIDEAESLNQSDDEAESVNRSLPQNDDESSILCQVPNHSVLVAQSCRLLVNLTNQSVKGCGMLYRKYQSINQTISQVLNQNSNQSVCQPNTQVKQTGISIIAKIATQCWCQPSLRLNTSSNDDSSDQSSHQSDNPPEHHIPVRSPSSPIDQSEDLFDSLIDSAVKKSINQQRSQSASNNQSMNNSHKLSSNSSLDYSSDLVDLLSLSLVVIINIAEQSAAVRQLLIESNLSVHQPSTQSSFSLGLVDLSNDQSFNQTINQSLNLLYDASPSPSFSDDQPFNQVINQPTNWIDLMIDVLAVTLFDQSINQVDPTEPSSPSTEQSINRSQILARMLGSYACMNLAILANHDSATFSLIQARLRQRPENRNVSHRAMSPTPIVSSPLGLITRNYSNNGLDQSNNQTNNQSNNQTNNQSVILSMRLIARVLNDFLTLHSGEAVSGDALESLTQLVLQLEKRIRVDSII